MSKIDYEYLKQKAKELDRPLGSLYALSGANDPFMAGMSRQARAEWFAATIWHALGIQTGGHLRRIFYRAISQSTALTMLDNAPFVNTEECWSELLSGSKDARYLGLIPPRSLVDRRSAEPTIFLADEAAEDAVAGTQSGGLISGEEIIAAPKLVLPKLRLYPPTIPQPYHLEIWCEKSTINDILMPLGEEYGVNVVTGVGEQSLTRCEELVDRARQSQRPVRIIYGSDFDPGGDSMPTAVARKIEFLLHNEGHDLDIQVRPILLTAEQCIAYRLPPSPIKESEKRAAAFKERWGVEGATELDALEALHPGELERILRKEIARYHDAGLDDRIADVAADAERDLSRATARVHRRHAGDIALLKAERDKVAAAIAACAPILARIQRDLQDNARDVDNYDWPEPADGDEDRDPLFDSTRDYFEQIDRYKEHQGKPTEFKLIDKTCAVCGEPFQARRTTARVCGDRCRLQLRYQPGNARAKRQQRATRS
jgi:hypothetical protein